jgi:hypothetical protein
MGRWCNGSTRGCDPLGKGSSPCDPPIRSTIMKVWILEPVDATAPPFDPWYDKCTGQIVVAEHEHEARELAGNRSAAEGIEPWLDGTLTTCTELDVTEARVVMQDVAWT